MIADMIYEQVLFRLPEKEAMLLLLMLNGEKDGGRKGESF